jgi:hypothetical protein
MKTALIYCGVAVSAFVAGAGCGAVAQRKLTLARLKKVMPLIANAVTSCIDKSMDGVTTHEELMAAVREEMSFIDIAMK